MYGYTLTLEAEGQEALAYKLLDQHYLPNNTADETFTLPDTLVSGVIYTVTVTATNVWGLTSTQTLTTTFTA